MVPWRGPRKIAFLPVARPRIDPVPPDWPAQIERRIYYDPSGPNGADVSLRTYIHTTSSGRADLEAVVLPMVEINQIDVPVDQFASRTADLRSQGFAAGALVMLGGVGAGSADCPGFWARFVMAEGVGVWAMELTHALTGYGDLYTNEPSDDLNSFDNMACNCGTHPTAYTKRHLGWLDAAAIARHASGDATFDLHAVGLVQPPAEGRVTAIEVPTGTTSLMIEARTRVDQFDTYIWSEGVIVYEVLSPNQNPTPERVVPLIRLRTHSALGVGQSFESSSSVGVDVVSALPGGFTVAVHAPVIPPSLQVAVPDVVNDPSTAAAHVINAAGLVAVFTGSGSVVGSQSPSGGTVVDRGTTVTMHLHTGATP